MQRTPFYEPSYNKRIVLYLSLLYVFFFLWMVIKHSLPDNKILDLSKLNVYAKENLNVVKMIEFVFKCSANIVEKGEKCWLP